MFLGSNWQYGSIGLDNGTDQAQTIIGTTDDWFTDAYMHHSASMG